MICSIKILFIDEKYSERSLSCWVFLAAVNSLQSKPVRVTLNFASQTTRPTIWINRNCTLEQAEQLFTAMVLHPHESNEIKQGRNRDKEGKYNGGREKLWSMKELKEKHRRHGIPSQGFFEGGFGEGSVLFGGLDFFWYFKTRSRGQKVLWQFQVPSFWSASGCYCCFSACLTSSLAVAGTWPVGTSLSNALTLNFHFHIYIAFKIRMQIRQL